MGGTVFMVIVDIAVRIIIAPQDVSIVIITREEGGAYFCWLIAKKV